MYTVDRSMFAPSIFAFICLWRNLDMNIDRSVVVYIKDNVFDNDLVQD